MDYAIVATKLDPKMKKEAQETAEALGVPLSVLIKGFLKQLIRTKTVTFSLHTHENEIPNLRTRKLLKKAHEDYMKGNTSPAFKTGEEAVKWLEEQGI